jgi:hypothetical protein
VESFSLLIDIFCSATGFIILLACGDEKLVPRFWIGIIGVGVVNADFLLLLAGDGVIPCGLDDNKGISPKAGSCSLWLI